MTMPFRIKKIGIAFHKLCLTAALLELCTSFSWAQSAPIIATTADTPNTREKAPPIFQSTDRVLAYYGPAVRKKLKPQFALQNVTYPPRAMTWIALKEEKQLLLFAKNKAGAYKQVLSYPIIGTSGVAG